MGVVSNVNETNNEVEKRSKKWKGNLLFYLFYYFLFFPYIGGNHSPRYWASRVTLFVVAGASAFWECLKRTLKVATHFILIYFIFSKKISRIVLALYSLIHWLTDAIFLVQTLLRHQQHQHQRTPSRHNHLILEGKYLTGIVKFRG